MNNLLILHLITFIINCPIIDGTSTIHGDCAH